MTTESGTGAAARDRAQKWIPVVDADLCNGCNLCIEACGPECLELVDNLAVLTVPDACGSEEHCIPVCAVEAIRMEWVEMEGDRGRGTWRPAESDNNGMAHAGNQD